MKKTMVILALSSVIQVFSQNKRDEKFVKSVAKDGLFEVKLAQLALSHGSTQEIRDLGKALLYDHKLCNEELKNNAGVYIAHIPAGLDDRDQKHYNKLDKLSGSDFDEAYTWCMMRMHNRSIKLFKKEAKKGKDPFKTWAVEKLELLERHYELSKALCENVN